MRGTRERKRGRDRMSVCVCVREREWAREKGGRERERERETHLDVTRTKVRLVLLERLGHIILLEERGLGNVERFRGGLIFQAHRLLYHSTLRSRVIKQRSSRSGSAGARTGLRFSGGRRGCSLGNVGGEGRRGGWGILTMALHI